MGEDKQGLLKAMTEDLTIPSFISSFFMLSSERTTTLQLSFLISDSFVTVYSVSFFK